MYSPKNLVSVIIISSKPKCAKLHVLRSKNKPVVPQWSNAHYNYLPFHNTHMWLNYWAGHSLGKLLFINISLFKTETKSYNCSGMSFWNFPETIYSLVRSLNSFSFPIHIHNTLMRKYYWKALILSNVQCFTILQSSM